MLLATEHSPAARRGFYGSWPQLGVPTGLLLSALIFSVVASSFPTTGFLAFGWRIPFLLSIVLVAFGLFIRLRIAETPDFERVRETGTIARMPVLDVIRTNFKSVVLAAGAFFVTNGAGAIYITFMVTYGSKILKVPASTMLNGILWGAVAMGVTILVAGRLSDRFGRLPVYLAGAAFVGLMAFPVFWLVNTKSPVFIALALAIGVGGTGIMYGPQAAFFSELFGANVRYSGASLGYQITAIFAGGLAPFIATALLAQFNNASWPIALYIVGMAVITLVCTYLAGETRPAATTDPAGGVAEN